MNRCDEIRARMTFYLDDELQGEERDSLEAHLANCKACRSFFESERRFLELVRQSAPLHVASLALRARIEELLRDLSAAPIAPTDLRERVRRSLQQIPIANRRFRSALRTITARPVLTTIVALVVVTGIWELSRSQRNVRYPRTSEFALMAANTHQRHQQGQLPLEIVSDAPQRISSWFAGKLPFIVKLPNYQESSGQEKLYQLEGARLVGYNNDYAAYVAYQMRTRPISLVITSDAVAQPSGGEEILAQGITFHYDSLHGLKVITWSDRGLTYALVSDLEERGQQSCSVCHQGTKDQNLIESLKPK